MKNTTNTINVTINGIEVSGTPAEVLALMSAMNGGAKLPQCVDYNTQGLESSTPTPAMPAKKSKTKVKSKFEIMPLENGSKKFYRIADRLWRAQENAPFKAIAKKMIENIEGIQSIETSFENKNGREVKYTAFGFSKKADAEKALKTLPAYIELEA